jgi:exosortase J
MATTSANAPPVKGSKLLILQAPSFVAGLAACLAVLGVVGIWPTAHVLYGMWVTDPLKSIGMLVPAVSFALILLRWRALSWRFDGSWWGFGLLLATVAAVRFREQSVLVLILSSRWSIFFPPHSLVAFCYVVGVVLLFGGWRLLKAARFAVLLIWLVNPVPHVFNVYVDLPLQRVSAHVARAFAMALHQKLTPDQMRLMFTPDFGMFIAPGCNGIRGAVTMGMIALIAGHLYRFRWRAHAWFVLGAVLLGYVFNFVRLCTLVLYYIVALKIPWLQDRAEMGDYIIGACLFLGAVALLFYAVRRVTEDPAEVEHGLEPQGSREEAEESLRAEPVWRSAGLRLAAMAVFVVVASGRLAHGMMRGREVAPAPETMEATTVFPERMGSYVRSRTWPEQVMNGPVIFEWADYQPAKGDGPHVAVGISPVLGSHDTSICHSARGEDPVWHGELRTQTATGQESFSSSFFNNGATQYLEVATVCNAGGCGEYTTGDAHFGLIYSRPAPAEAFRGIRDGRFR